MSHHALEVPTGVSPVQRALTPPRGFRGSEGLRDAKMVDAGPWGPHTRPLRGSAAKKAGIRYERKVLALLKECFRDFKAEQWFLFYDREGKPRYCQTDGLLLCPDGAIIFEVKIRSTSDAWFQLQSKYRPVVEKATGLPVRALVQICRSFDPATPYPCEVIHLNDISLEAILAAQSRGKLLSYSWRL